MKKLSALFALTFASSPFADATLTLDTVNKHDNVYADLALSMTYEANVEWFVHEVSSKKVIYGSDAPFFDPRPAFGRVALADITDDEKKDIFGLNIKRILDQKNK